MGNAWGWPSQVVPGAGQQGSELCRIRRQVGDHRSHRGVGVDDEVDGHGRAPGVRDAGLVDQEPTQKAGAPGDHEGRGRRHVQLWPASRRFFTLALM